MAHDAEEPRADREATNRIVTELTEATWQYVKRTSEATDEAVTALRAAITELANMGLALALVLKAKGLVSDDELKQARQMIAAAHEVDRLFKPPDADADAPEEAR